MFIDNQFDERVFEYVELTQFPGDSKIEIERICNLYQRSLNIKKGPIFKVVYFDLGDQDGRILIIVHHLAIDGVSWRIILECCYLITGIKNTDYQIKLVQ